MSCEGLRPWTPSDLCFVDPTQHLACKNTYHPLRHSAIADAYLSPVRKNTHNIQYPRNCTIKTSKTLHISQTRLPTHYPEPTLFIKTFFNPNIIQPSFHSPSTLNLSWISETGLVRPPISQGFRKIQKRPKVR